MDYGASHRNIHECIQFVGLLKNEECFLVDLLAKLTPILKAPAESLRIFSNNVSSFKELACHSFFNPRKHKASFEADKNE
jgi:hypothetical protein